MLTSHQVLHRHRCQLLLLLLLLSRLLKHAESCAESFRLSAAAAGPHQRANEFRQLKLLLQLLL
jgi:hypothetical protein